jgi:hypothetical protein
MRHALMALQDDGGEQPAALPEAGGAKGDKASSEATRKAEKAAQKVSLLLSCG